MKVYMFSDYLNSIQGELLKESQAICDIDDITEFPSGLISVNGRVARACSMSDRENFITIEFIDVIPNDDDVHCSGEITCPHCGSENSDSWDYSDSDDNYTCETCDSVFSYVRNVEVTYSSTIIDRNANIQKLDDGV